LVLTARRPDRLAALIEEVRSLGVDGVAVIGDAREEETALKAVGAAKAFGRVDILINNVGVGNYKKLVDTSLEDYVEMMDVNVRSTFLFSHHVAPVMIAQGDASS
jgi:NADP-dependent 3-hydroxy acid dehydrogenase YdfG